MKRSLANQSRAISIFGSVEGAQATVAGACWTAARLSYWRKQRTQRSKVMSFLLRIKRRVNSLLNSIMRGRTTPSIAYWLRSRAQNCITLDRGARRTL